MIAVVSRQHTRSHVYGIRIDGVAQQLCIRHRVHENVQRCCRCPYPNARLLTQAYLL